jgi:hypothetical protein
MVDVGSNPTLGSSPSISMGICIINWTIMWHPAALSEEFFKTIDYPNHMKATEYCQYVYLIINDDNNLCKIGITNNLRQRFKRLINSGGINLSILITLECEIDYDEHPLIIEKFIHKYFKHKKIVGEWFNLDIKDILAIRKLFYDIYGNDIKDNIKKYFCQPIT